MRNTLAMFLSRFTCSIQIHAFTFNKQFDFEGKLHRTEIQDITEVHSIQLNSTQIKYLEFQIKNTMAYE